MTVNSDAMVSITDANQNFSKVARLVDEKGAVVVLKNNAPRYLIIDFSKAQQEQIARSESVEDISERLIRKNSQAYRDLA